MFQSLNDKNDIIKMVRIHCENLKSTPRESVQLGLKTELSMKSDYGLKLESLLINMSLQVGFSVLDIDSVFVEVIYFFDTYSSSGLWLDRIEMNIKNALKKQKQTKKAV